MANIWGQIGSSILNSYLNGGGGGYGGPQTVVGGGYSRGVPGMGMGNKPSPTVAGVPGVSGAGGGAGSIWTQLATSPAMWQTAGAMLGAAGDNAAAERHARVDSEGRTLRRLQNAEAISSSEGYTPRPGLPSYGFGPKPASAQVKASAAQLQKELIERLAQGDDPGLLERIANIVAPAAYVYGSARAPRAGTPPQTTAPASVPQTAGTLFPENMGTFF